MCLGLCSRTWPLRGCWGSSGCGKLLGHRHWWGRPRALVDARCMRLELGISAVSSIQVTALQGSTSWGGHACLGLPHTAAVDHAVLVPAVTAGRGLCGMTNVRCITARSVCTLEDGRRSKSGAASRCSFQQASGPNTSERSRFNTYRIAC
jgi:hypothetical protein